MSHGPLLTTVLLVVCSALPPVRGFAQTSNASTPVAAQAGDQAPGDNAQQRSWLVRDPTTGRLYQQEVVTRTVPTTHWEVRPVPTTVYEPRQVVTTVPRQEVTYTPTTQYVMQPRVKGWWNPLAQPVQTYEFVPVTSWQPQTQTVQQPITTTQWVAKQHTVYVPQAVQRNETQQQIVSREIPQPNGGYPPSSMSPGVLPPATMMAAQQNPIMTRPLVSIPLLARQPATAWNSSPWPTSVGPAAVSGGIASSGVRAGGFSNALRPIANPLAPTYSAPLQTASSSGSLARDAGQSGMSATVLR